MTLRPLAALLAAATAMSACEPPPPMDDEGEAEDSVGTGPLDALTRRFGRLRTRMRERGYRDEMMFGRRFVLEGQGVSVPLDLPANRCTTFVALGGAALREVVLSVFDGEGTVVATDSAPGEGGLAHVCPQTGDGSPTMPHYFVMQAAEGSGAVVSGAFVSELGAGEGFEGLFDGVLAPEVPFREVEEQIARARSLARGRGLLPLAEPTVDAVAEGEGLRFVATLEVGRCYVALARGDDAISDVDLVVHDRGGVEVARDLDSDAEPTLEWCPEVGGAHTFEARAFSGAGALGLLVLVGLAPDPDASEAVEPVEEPPEVVAPPSADPMAALGVVATALAARGYAAPIYVTMDSDVAPGEVRTHEVFLGPGCTVLVGAAGSGETDLDLYLADVEGNPVDRDTGVQPVARVGACLDEPGIQRVTVKAYGRRGGYALAALAAPAEISDVRTLRLDEAAATFRARGYRVVGGNVFTLSSGEALTRAVFVRPGACIAVAAAGDVGVTDVDLLLRDGDGELVASAAGPEPWAAVSRCAEDEPEDLMLSIRAYRGSGTVALSRLEGVP